MQKIVHARKGSQKGAGFVFEVNPLVLQVVLQIEDELLERRPEFRSLDHPNRVTEICKELFLSEVVEVEFQSTPAWVPSREIERECGGSNILTRSRYQLNASMSAEEKNNFRKVVRAQLRRRLNPIVKEFVLAFESYNAGLTSIESVAYDGRLNWRPSGLEVVLPTFKASIN
jgi:hypothetical protein